MYEQLEKINARPKPFEFYTSSELWNDKHTSKKMLAAHLDLDDDRASRNAAFVNRSVEWICSQFNVGSGTKIADFGCGPGLYAQRLAQKQADVTGVDFSIRSIEYARNNAITNKLPINYINEDYLNFDTNERYDLILLIFCDLCVLSPVQRKTMLNKFYTFLKPGGSLLLDVYSLTEYGKCKENTLYEVDLSNGLWSSNRYFGFSNTFKYETDKVVLDKYTIIEKSRTRTIYNWLQYFSAESIEKEVKECGFKIENLYSDVTGLPFESDSKEIAVVARK